MKFGRSFASLSQHLSVRNVLGLILCGNEALPALPVRPCVRACVGVCVCVLARKSEPLKPLRCLTGFGPNINIATRHFVGSSFPFFVGQF